MLLYDRSQYYYLYVTNAEDIKFDLVLFKKNQCGHLSKV